MNPWQKETLNHQVGDFIIWQGEAIEVEGQTAVVTPGMKGKVLSLHDGFHLDVVQVEPPAQGHCAVREWHGPGGGSADEVGAPLRIQIVALRWSID